MDEGKAKGLLNRLAERIKADRRLELIIYAALALLCVALLIGSNRGDDGATDEYMPGQSQYNDSESIERRLTETLSLVRGAGRVEVMITYDTGNEIVPAMSRDVSESGEGAGAGRMESSEPVTVYRDGEDGALVLMERMPKVRGVLVVAEGAADISVRMKLQGAVSAVLGVEASRVEVLEMGIKGLEGEG